MVQKVIDAAASPKIGGTRTHTATRYTIPDFVHKSKSTAHHIQKWGVAVFYEIRGGGKSMDSAKMPENSGNFDKSTHTAVSARDCIPS